jgi:hypothetical protein
MQVDQCARHASGDGSRVGSLLKDQSSHAAAIGRPADRKAAHQGQCLLLLAQYIFISTPIPPAQHREPRAWIIFKIRLQILERRRSVMAVESLEAVLVDDDDPPSLVRWVIVPLAEVASINR